MSLRSSPRVSRPNFRFTAGSSTKHRCPCHHISGETVALLEHTFKLLALSVDLSQIVIGEFTPLLFDLTLSLLPISFNAVPVHFTPPRTKPPKRNVATCRAVPHIG